MEIPTGFFFATAKAGFRGKNRPDLAYIGSDRPASAAGVFTRNVFQAAPVLVAREGLESGTARGILVNVGQANACTGEQGMEDCRESLRYAASSLDLTPEDILPASTGVIGESLEMERFREGIRDLVAGTPATPLDAARAITTTDTFPKLCTRRLECESGDSVRITGLAKGAGMICPNMATMLAFVCTDAAVDPEAWRTMLVEAAEESFNRISVDGDTSTNDCLMGLANGTSVRPRGKDLERFRELLGEMCRELSYMIVQDAEGGTKILDIRVSGAEDDDQADMAVRSVAHSPLVKTAMYGLDPNWGRIVAALGRSGARFDPQALSLTISGVPLLEKGMLATSDVDGLLGGVMKRQEIRIHADLGRGSGCSRILTSDLSTEYVRINAEYRS